ncbi:MAG: dUTP diphosphatase [Bowdeniella nasicola]|nr:dUTP diphosphatase [Bowdeniella nasicola]
MNELPIRIQLRHAQAQPPTYAHEGDAGADLRAVCDVRIGPLERALVPTGIAIALPAGYAAFVHPRSGLALKYGLTVVNAPGTIDAGYRGEIGVIMHNTDAHQSAQIRAGDRIAQLVIQRVTRARFDVVDVLDDTQRSGGGFGSSGV